LYLTYPPWRGEGLRRISGCGFVFRFVFWQSVDKGLIRHSAIHVSALVSLFLVVVMQVGFEILLHLLNVNGNPAHLVEPSSIG